MIWLGSDQRRQDSCQNGAPKSSQEGLIRLVTTYLIHFQGLHSHIYIYLDFLGGAAGMRTFGSWHFLHFWSVKCWKHVTARLLLENATTSCISQSENQASTKPLNTWSFLFAILVLVDTDSKASTSQRIVVIGNWTARIRRVPDVFKVFMCYWTTRWWFQTCWNVHRCN